MMDRVCVHMNDTICRYTGYLVKETDSYIKIIDDDSGHFIMIPWHRIRVADVSDF